MRIGIEAQRIFRRNKHGMDYVVLEEIKQLQQMDKENEYYVFVAPGEDRCLEESPNVHIKVIGCGFYPVWEQIVLPHNVRKLKLDILHCTSNTAPIFCKAPIILTLHDIIFLEKRDKMNQSVYQNMGWFYRRIVVPHILKKSKRIITVSDFELQNIVNKLNIPREKMVMIHNGYNEWFKKTIDTEQIYRKYIDQPSYFFFLGNTDPKKNTERTLIAYSKYLEQSDVKRKLLVADLERRYVDEIIDRNHIENIRKTIVTPGYIVNRDLPFIYNNAFAFLYPSLRESFGIPLLEAMACGTPVITSNTSSMPEIGGPEAILVNPERTEDITKMMLKLEQDDTYYQEQEKMGLQRAKLFSWKSTTEQLLNLYDNVYKNKG
ncbi:MAG: glycosyltransferase family 4 protein [Prevotella sp.]|nr:glycosyltransferase family 4 protein [Prevotella sp.]